MTIRSRAPDHGSWQQLYDHCVRCKLYFDAKNLLNTPLEFTEGTSQNRAHPA